MKNLREHQVHSSKELGALKERDGPKVTVPGRREKGHTVPELYNLMSPSDESKSWLFCEHT